MGYDWDDCAEELEYRQKHGKRNKRVAELWDPDNEYRFNWNKN